MLHYIFLSLDNHLVNLFIYILFQFGGPTTVRIPFHELVDKRSTIFHNPQIMIPYILRKKEKCQVCVCDRMSEPLGTRKRIKKDSKIKSLHTNMTYVANCYLSLSKK